MWYSDQNKKSGDWQIGIVATAALPAIMQGEMTNSISQIYQEH